MRGQYALQPYFTFGPGDVLQMNGEHFAALGKYRAADSSEYFALLIEYPDTALAEQALASVTANLDPYSSVVDQWTEGLLFQDYRQHYAMVRREGSRLIGIMDCAVPLTRKSAIGEAL